MFHLPVGPFSFLLARLGLTDYAVKASAPAPKEAFALTYCAVCGRPIAPNSQILELRFGRLVNGATADIAGNRSAPAFVHAGMGNGVANCLSQAGLVTALRAAGTQLRLEPLFPEPEKARPKGKLIFLPQAEPTEPEAEPTEPEPISFGRRRTDPENDWPES